MENPTNPKELPDRLLKMFNKKVYFCRMNVYMFRVCNREGHLLKKPWTIMTTDASSTSMQPERVTVSMIMYPWPELVIKP